MTVEKTLRHCMLKYPSIFPTKWSVYNHWFTVIGNGYDWVDGELTDGDNEEFTLLDSINRIFERNFGKYKHEEIKEKESHFFIAHNADQSKEQILTVLALEENILKFYGYPSYVRLSEYSKINNLPSDIKPDWLDAANEMKKWISENLNK